MSRRLDCSSVFLLLMLCWLVVLPLEVSSFRSSLIDGRSPSTGWRYFGPSYQQQRLATRRLSAKKGFGNVPEPAPKKKPSIAVDDTDATIIPEASADLETSSSSTSMNAGQRALEKMRRERAEQRDRELRQVRELLQTDQQVQEAPAAIPEKVAQRMGARMLPFVGIPLLGSMGTFVAFWYLATYKNMEFQPALVASATVFFLVVGLLGITYSVLSASWDENREGDLLGTDEFQRNLDNIKEGLSRSRENAVLRDKMAGLSDDELQRALRDLEQREKQTQQQEQKKASLEAKLKDELE